MAIKSPIKLPSEVDPATNHSILVLGKIFSVAEMATLPMLLILLSKLSGLETYVATDSLPVV